MSSEIANEPSGRREPDADRRRAQPPWLAIALGTALVLAAAFAAWWFFIRDAEEGGGAQAQGPPPAVVAAAQAELQSWRTQLTAVGTLQAVRGIDVTAEAAGKVARIAFEAGQQVRKGELLVALDTDTERAALRSLQAQLQKARTDEARARRLIARGAIAEAELERAATETDSLQAQYEQQRTLIGKKTIEAPFAGQLGIRMISPGQLISPGSPIVTLQSIAPIFANFKLPERAYAQVRPGQRVEIEVSAHPDRRFAGEVHAIDPKIAEATRSFTVQALLANEDALLRPGMFADVTIDLGGAREVVAVPATAVAFSAYGESVFFVREPQQPANGAPGEGRPAAPRAGPPQKPGGDGAQQPPRGPVMQAQRAFVETGERRGLMIEVIKGVRPGERVVTAGQLKLDDGFPIIVADSDALEAARSRPLKP